MGSLTVKTTPVAYPVKVNGQVMGMSGVNTPAEFFLNPGFHRVEIEGPNGQSFSKEIEIRRDVKHCICLRIVEEILSRECPYNVRVDGPETVSEGDLITFVAVNAVTSSIPINYRWRVTPSTARITSGLGTPAITVDTTGMGNQTVNVELDVTDDVYGATCQQRNSISTGVIPIPPVEIPQPFQCDIFESRAFDDDKARFDNCVIELRNRPDAQIYIILYQGTDRASRTNNVDRLGRRTLDYLVQTRGVDPRQITITNWGTRPRTTVEVWIVPPGAQPPVPR
jgi:hypothetical protein